MHAIVRVSITQSAFRLYLTETILALPGIPAVGKTAC